MTHNPDHPAGGAGAVKALETFDEGIDFAMSQLCTFLGVDERSISWDAATETLDGDVRSVIGNILRAHFGEDWGPASSPVPEPEDYKTKRLNEARAQSPDWEALWAEQAERADRLAEELATYRRPHGEVMDELDQAYRLEQETPEGGAISSAELIRRCGGDPDAQFERGPFPPEMRQFLVAPATVPEPEVVCEHCDGTGDVHSIDGEWKGECVCGKSVDTDDVIGCLLAEKPFWFDPATHFVHADDGGARGTRWVPEPEADGEAVAFITKLVNMQSGAGWTRAVVRDAAARFLHERGLKVPNGPDSTPEMIRKAALSPTPPVPEPEAEGGAVAFGWLIELKGGVPSWAIVNPNDYDEHWTTDSTRALRFARKIDAEAYIAHIGWTEAFASEHIWDDGLPSSGPAPETWRDLDDVRLKRAIDAFYEPCEGTTIDGIRNAILAWERG